MVVQFSIVVEKEKEKEKEKSKIMHNKLAQQTRHSLAKKVR